MKSRTRSNLTPSNSTQPNPTRNTHSSPTNQHISKCHQSHQSAHKSACLADSIPAANRAASPTSTTPSPSPRTSASSRVLRFSVSLWDSFRAVSLIIFCLLCKTPNLIYAPHDVRDSNGTAKKMKPLASKDGTDAERPRDNLDLSFDRRQAFQQGGKEAATMQYSMIPPKTTRTTHIAAAILAPPLYNNHPSTTKLHTQLNKNKWNKWADGLRPWKSEISQRTDDGRLGKFINPDIISVCLQNISVHPLTLPLSPLSRQSQKQGQYTETQIRHGSNTNHTCDSGVKEKRSQFLASSISFHPVPTRFPN